METLITLFSPMMVFVYHCFDRIVINGYISMLSRPGNIVYFFQNIMAEKCITKNTLASMTKPYNKMIETYVNEKGLPMEWAQKGVRKEDYVRPYLKTMKRKKLFGVYFVIKSMEQGSTFRSVKPRYPTQNPDYRIIKRNRSRFTYYYFYIRDEILGPMCIRVGSYLPFQTTCFLNGHNFIEQELLRSGIPYRMNDNAFVSIKDTTALQKAADKLSPEIIRERIEYWTTIVGPQFSKNQKTRMNLSRFYAITQVLESTVFIRRYFTLQASILPTYLNLFFR